MAGEQGTEAGGSSSGAAHRGGCTSRATRASGAARRGGCASPPTAMARGPVTVCTLTAGAGARAEAEAGVGAEAEARSSGQSGRGGPAMRWTCDGTVLERPHHRPPRRRRLTSTPPWPDDRRPRFNSGWHLNSHRFALRERGETSQAHISCD